MPFPGFEEFDSMSGCIDYMMENQDYNEETAGAVCADLHPEDPSEMSEKLNEEDLEDFQELVREEIESEEGDPKSLLDKIDEAGSIISDGMLEMVSAVGNPAQPSDWIMMKSEDDNYDWKSSSPLVLKQKEDKDLRIAYASALVPNVVDKDGDVVPATVIRKMAHNFLKEDGDIDEEHNLIEGKGEVVESWLLKEERSFELPDGEEKVYPAGTWMLGIEFVPETWEKIKSGELSGLSIYGKSQHIELKSSFECPHCGEKVMVDNTENGKVKFIKPLSDEEEKNYDTMSEEDINEINEQLTELKEQLSEVKDELNEPETPENPEKQEVEDIADVIEWLEENAPDEVASMAVDALRSVEESESEDDKDETDESPEEPENPEKEESEDGDSDTEAKYKKGNEEETRKAQADVGEPKEISFKDKLLGGE